LGIFADAIWTADAGQSFQGFMDEVLAGLNFAFCYLDVILITSSSRRSIFNTCSWCYSGCNSGLMLNMEK
jgi:hypothetical protein